MGIPTTKSRRGLLFEGLLGYYTYTSHTSYVRFFALYISFASYALQPLFTRIRLRHDLQVPSHHPDLFMFSCTVKTPATIYHGGICISSPSAP